MANNNCNKKQEMLEAVKKNGMKGAILKNRGEVPIYKPTDADMMKGGGVVKL